MLANILRTDMAMHRALPADTEQAESVTVLARAHQDAVWRLQRAGNELRSLLREYFPAFLEIFASKKAASPAAKRAPSSRSQRHLPRRPGSPVRGSGRP
jgi:hypothetical protein